MSYTQEQISFIEKAKEHISDNPISRLSEITKSTLERGNFVFDAHCHVFDGDCINVAYLATRMIAGAPEDLKERIWRLITGEQFVNEKSFLSTEQKIEKIHNQPNVIPEHDNFDQFVSRLELDIENEMKGLDDKSMTSFSFREFLVRLRHILQLLSTKRMSDVYVKFRDLYAIHKVINTAYETNHELVTIVLGMDLNSGWQGKIKKTHIQQNDELGALPQAYPVLPFLPIDPRRANDIGEKNLYNFFLKAFNKDNPSFFGVKCYPSLGYLPSDSRLKPIFQICAEKNIPVLTHCGGESVSTFENPITVNRNGIKESVSLHPRKERARFLNEPAEWLEVLRAHPNLKLCFGHFGSGSAWEDPNSISAHRIPTIIEMMGNFNVFADFSFNLESSKATDNFVAMINKGDKDGKLIQERTMFGTDFWVVLPMSNLNSDQRYFIEKIGESRDNLLKHNVINYLGLKGLY